jgi:hypothetical protein
MRLSPRDSRRYAMMSAMAYAHFAAGRHAEAAEWCERSLRAGHFIPSHTLLVASLAQDGRLDDARRALARLLELDPGCRVGSLRVILGRRRPADIERYLDGLRRAGLPE